MQAKERVSRERGKKGATGGGHLVCLSGNPSEGEDDMEVDEWVEEEGAAVFKKTKDCAKTKESEDKPEKPNGE